MPTLNKDVQPSKSPAWSIRDEIDQPTLRNESQDRELGLNLSAITVWALCDGTRSMADIGRMLEADMQLAEGSLEKDIEFAVRGLADIGAVQLPLRRELPRERTDRIRWDRLSRPQYDLGDIEGAMQVFRSDYGDARLKPTIMFELDTAFTLCDGDIVVDYCYDDGLHGMENAPRDHANLSVADNYLRRWPFGFELVKALIHTLHPVSAPDDVADADGFLWTSYCHSLDDPHEFGAVRSTIGHPFLLAENLVHEAAHQKLFALGIRKDDCDRLIENSTDELFKSPVVEYRARPMPALVHAIYSYMYVLAFDLAFWRCAQPGSLKNLAMNRIEANTKRLLQGRNAMTAGRRASADGNAFFAGFDRWLDELIADGRQVSGIETVSLVNASYISHSSTEEPVRIFVGSDPRQGKADLTLAYSARKFTSGPVEVEYMDYTRGGLWDGWDIGRQRGEVTQEPKPGWATEFTCYRFAIPEAAGFRGRAIYMDSDMFVVDDLRKLFDMEMRKPWLIASNCPATMLIDCAFFADQAWWPSIDDMKNSGWGLGDYMHLLARHVASGPLDERWNCHDGDGYQPGTTGIIHFTTRAAQPWRPYPEVFDYSAHWNADIESMWWDLYREAVDEADA